MTPAASAIRAALEGAELDWEQISENDFVVTMAGVDKQKVTATLSVGEQALTVNAFVARHPDENAAAVHAWLLERNRRQFAVAFCIDQFGDIYLVGRLPVESIDEAAIDRILGSVLEYADSSFNKILELGFGSSIRREWQWRKERGLPTDNLAAFAHFAERDSQDGASGSIGA